MNPTEPNFPSHVTPKTSLSAIFSLVLGIIGMCFPLLSLPAVILGHVGLKAVKKSQ